MIMNSKLFVAFSAMAVLTACGGAQQSAPEQLETNNSPLSEQLVMSTLWFQNSYGAELAYEQAYELATTRMQQNLRRMRNDSRPVAVIVDIDETVLDNSPYEARLIQSGESYNSASWAKWVQESQARILPGAKSFLTMAEQMGVEVFYISNRSEDLMAPTIENLRRYGLPHANEDHLLLKTETSDKTMRREMVRNTHKVILLVGDQPGDFSEEFHDYMNGPMRDSLRRSFIMLPNPMYGEFESKLYEDRDPGAEQKAFMRKRALRIE